MNGKRRTPSSVTSGERLRPCPRARSSTPTATPGSQRLVEVARDLKVPGDVDPKALIAKVGDTWRSWGWYVFEHDGFNKPNQFGYGPDGYRLQIEMSNPPSYPPTLTAISPCSAPI